MDSGRRSHRKSRKGCMQCKKRKIKCDETKPACNNCIRHKTTCQYVAVTGTGASGSGSQSHISATSPTQLPGQHHGINHGLDSDRSVSNGPVTNSEFSMIEMDLLHAYSTYTCYTFEPDPVVQNVWRVCVPQIGFAHRYVMRGILSISALHRAYSRPALKNQYVNIALEHHDRGLAEATQSLLTPSDSNCIPLFLFSALTGMISFAKPRKPGDWLLLGQDGVADWLMLLRGTMSIINNHRETLISSEIGPMLTNGIRRLKIWEASENQKHEFLENLCHNLRNVVTDDANLAVYLGAVRTLGRSFSLLPNTQSLSKESSDAFIWFFEVSAEYLHLLYTREQEAMAIFAFYCAFLKNMEYTWFLKGWSMHLISVIWKTLDHEHRMWIQWPVEQIGWIPS